MGPPFEVRHFVVVVPLWEAAVVVREWLVGKFRTVVLMPALDHRRCEHMVMPVPGFGGRALVMSLL